MTSGRAKTREAKERQLIAQQKSGVTRSQGPAAATPPPATGQQGLGGALYDSLERMRAADARHKEARAHEAEINNQIRAKTLCHRDAATAEVRRLATLVRANLDRVNSYLDPSLSPENRAVCEKALAAVTQKVRHGLAQQGLDRQAAP
jgi:hypothetical protein